MLHEPSSSTHRGAQILCDSVNTRKNTGKGQVIILAKSYHTKLVWVPYLWDVVYQGVETNLEHSNRLRSSKTFHCSWQFHSFVLHVLMICFTPSFYIYIIGNLFLLQLRKTNWVNIALFRTSAQKPSKQFREIMPQVFSFRE